GIHPPGTFDGLIERIKNAVKFNLSPEFTQAADALAADFKQVTKALEFCRLPYREVWFELSQTNRPNFVAGALPQVWQGVPIKVGFLLTATSDDLSSFKAHEFWSCLSPFAGEIAYSVSVLATQFDMRKHAPGPDKAAIRIHHSPAWKTASPDIRARMLSAVSICSPDFE